MKISVIIPTLDRADAVRNVLSDLGQQTLGPLEVIIADQSEGATERLECLDNNAEVRWLALTPPNASRARNTAARLAKGDWLLFLDDDVRFESALLEKFAIVVAELNIDACTGGVLGPKDDWSDEPKPESDGRYMLSMRRFSSYRTTRLSMPVEGACSANFIIKREVLFSIGGFDERYPGICEDSDLGFRLAAHGFRVWHDPRPWLDHLMIPSGGSRPKAKTWEEQNLSIVLPRVLKCHLLMLTEHFGWRAAAAFLLLRLSQYALGRGLYMERPLFMFSVVKLLIESTQQARFLHLQGPQLSLKAAANL